MSDNKEYNNIPPKDIQNAIWGACFDYKDFDELCDGKTVRDRIYECWNRMHNIIKKNQEEFSAHIIKNEPEI